MPLPKKVGIDFILSNRSAEGNEISEEEHRKAMLEITDMYMQFPARICLENGFTPFSQFSTTWCR
jgi:hypothetical protein